MASSRVAAPLQQWVPRLIGLSNAGSCPIQTPLSTSAQMLQPTAQNGQTVFLRSIPGGSCGFGSAARTCRGLRLAMTPSPTAVTPDASRKPRRERRGLGTWARAACRPRGRRDWRSRRLVSMAGLSTSRAASAARQFIKGADVIGFAVVELAVVGGTLRFFGRGFGRRRQRSRRRGGETRQRNASKHRAAACGFYRCV